MKKNFQGVGVDWLPQESPHIYVPRTYCNIYEMPYLDELLRGRAVEESWEARQRDSQKTERSYRPLTLFMPHVL